MKPWTVAALSTIGMLATSAAVLAVVPPPTPAWVASSAAASARSVAPDAAAPTISAGNGIRCGVTMCLSSEVCLGDDDPRCVAYGSQPPSPDGRIPAAIQHTCDEHADCPGGEVCALLLGARGGGFSCLPAAEGVSSAVCSTSTDCPSGATCQTASFAPWLRSCAAAAAPRPRTSIAALRALRRR